MEEVIVILLLGIVLAIPYLCSTFFARPIEQESTVKNRLAFFDAVRGIAILAVIWIHTRRFFQLYSETNDYSFLFISNNLTRFAIPFFLICSGILLNPKVQSWWKFYYKKIIRVGIPYALATLFLVLLVGRPDLFGYMLITGDASVPYYFMVILFQCYLLYPLIVRVRQYKHELVIGTFFLSLFSYFYPDSWKFGEIPLVTKYLFFFVYGYVYRDFFLNFVAKKKHLIAWSTITFLYILLITIDLDLFYNVRLFYGVALFNLLFFIKPLVEKIKPLSWIGKQSLWIYLLHYPLSEAVYFMLSPTISNYYVSYVAIFVTSILVTIPLSYALHLGYNKIIKLAQ